VIVHAVQPVDRHELITGYVAKVGWLVGWGFTALSAQKGHIMPMEGTKLMY